MKFLFCLTISLFLWGSDVFAQKTEDELYKLLQQGKYRQLVNKVCSLREKEYYKNPFMDYCLAYGYCQLNKPALSQEWFDHILASYNNFSFEKRKELIRLKQNCTEINTADLPTDALLGFLRGMSSEGFASNNSGIESKMGIPSLTDTIKGFDFEHLTFDSQNRKFTKNQKRKALAYYQQLLTTMKLKVDTTEHFLVFYPSNAQAINNHINQLERYYEYYSSTFNLSKSDRLITIFYCTYRKDFNQIAQQVHNIPVPESTFGYASSVDLVMMGIANFAWLGAMKHELFHLMIRSYIGDIPPWLDEGVACYFESSKLTGNEASTNLSSSNYRINLLKETELVKYRLKNNPKAKFIVPTLQQLTNYDWQEFSGVNGELMIKASYNQSLSYAFVAFLQDRKFLNPAIDGFRNRAYTENQTNGLTILHLRSNDEILKKVTGLNPEEIQFEFNQWCKKNYITIY